MAQDLRRSFFLALRRSGRSPGLTVAVILTLALGFGANITIFSLVDAVLFRPLPVPDPDRLVALLSRIPERPEDVLSSYPAFAEDRDRATAFSAQAAYSGVHPLHLAAGGRPAQRVDGMLVTGGYFRLLGARPLRGVLLSPADDSAAAPPVLVLGESLWRRQFGGDDRIVGRSVQLNQHPFTVIGVVPAGFTGPSLEAHPDLWVPVAKVDQALPNYATFHPLTRRGFSWLQRVARLRPGTSLAGAQAQLDALSRQWTVTSTDPKGLRMQAVPAAEAAFDPARKVALTRMSWVLLGVVVAILLIAGAVVSGLLLVSLERRRKEIALQVALGISRRRLSGELLGQSLLLSALGAVAGFGLSSLARRLLLARLPAGLPIPTQVASSLADPRVLAFTVAACLAVGLLFGLAPALRALATAPAGTLKGEGGGVSRSGLALRHAFVVFQVALSTVLLLVAGLLLRTLSRITATAPGFAPQGVLTASLDLGLQGYAPEAGTRFAAALHDRLAHTPGIVGAAVAGSVPGTFSVLGLSFQVAGYRPRPGEELEADFDPVTPGYFKTLGIPLLRGRDFTEQDGAKAPAVAIVNETMARRYWVGGPGRDAIGQRLGDVAPQGALIVGVVADVKHKGPRIPAVPMFYMPLAQFSWPSLTVAVRTQGDPRVALPALRQAVAGLDRGLPLFDVQTLEERVERSLARERAVAGLFSAFGLLALLLAVGGLYSVISYATELRTREFGIRMALGSGASGVRRLVLRQGVVLALSGLGLGLLAAFGLTSLLSSLLVEISATDPATFVTIPLLLTGVALLACLLPAYRATRGNPMLALRSE
ncbi:MAG TPA: ABC transporter permease [Thermoanaerobaculia bacterium]|nr:ABC transporter permease [Thermoanaerobaculia bacterium]